MEFKIFEEKSPQIWDQEISQYDTKYLFHHTRWLKFLTASQGGEIIRMQIKEKNITKGFFVGILLKKGPIKILGSPLTGWTTEYMGPIADKTLDWEQFLVVLDHFCQKLKIQHIEICNPILEPDLMTRMGYKITEKVTYIVPLSVNEETMWQSLKSNCRNRIRKGKKNGLIVENTADPEFARRYYQQLVEVFVKQNLIPTYTIERVKDLYKNLKPDLLLTLDVKYNGHSVATGLFPHDDRCIYFFGGASHPESLKLYPNELLHWTAMSLAARIGIRQYDMCGGGSGHFKSKFGGKQIPVYKYYKNYSKLASIGRQVYKLAFQGKQRIMGALKTRQQ